ncbi:MAG TPA: ribonuclease HII [Candidatus Binatia bacterium]|jgi:ribonuclease HII|nr:ribonuclease HII [Candidatus Binatia bacterium]
MGARRTKRRRGPATAAPHLETLLWRVGIRHVAGVDEVGMGPLAGPVVAAAVVFPPGTKIDGIADSKALPAAVRERLAGEIRRRAVAVGLAVVEPDEIDRVNIYQAGLLALRRAVEALDVVPGYVLVDGREIPGLAMPQSAYPKGDSFVCSIAAASIVAKVHRDAIMRELDARYPAYGFGRHMGYSTAAHFAAIRAHGPSPVHRRSFAPVRALVDAAADSQMALLPAG